MDKRSLVSYHPWVFKESDTTEYTDHRPILQVNRRPRPWLVKAS